MYDTLKELYVKYEIIQANRIDYGWSDDEKWCLTSKNKNIYLLRLNSRDRWAEKKNDFRIIKKMNHIDALMSQAIEAGIIEKDNKSFMLLSWINGIALDTIITSLPDNEQFSLGVYAGKVLRKIHQIPVETGDLPQRKKAEIKLKQLEEYMASNYRIKNDGNVILYLKANMALIDLQNNVYEHGDYHFGNFIYTPEKRLGIIDFDRVGCGEGYEEFYKIQSFEIEKSIPFSIGQLKGYFGENPPEDFWTIQKIYVAHASLYSIRWAEKYGEEEVAGMIARCRRAFQDYSDFNNLIPQWYMKYEKQYQLLTE